MPEKPPMRFALVVKALSAPAFSYSQLLKQKKRESKPSRPCILVMGSEKTRMTQMWP